MAKTVIVTQRKSIRDTLWKASLLLNDARSEILFKDKALAARLKELSKSITDIMAEMDE